MTARQMFQRQSDSFRRNTIRNRHFQRRLKLEILEQRQLLDSDPSDGGLAFGLTLLAQSGGSDGAIEFAPDTARESVPADDPSGFAFDSTMAAQAHSAQLISTDESPFKWTADYLGTAVGQAQPCCVFDAMPSIMYDRSATPDKRFKMWWWGGCDPNYPEPPGVRDTSDRIYYADSPDGSNWYNRQIVLKGQGGLGGEITADDHLLGAPSVLKVGDKYYMFYEAFGNWATVVNRFFSFARGDTWVTSGVSVGYQAGSNGFDGVRRGDWQDADGDGHEDQDYDYENYPLGFAPYLKKAGTHPVYTGEVQYTSGKLNRYVSLTLPQAGTDSNGYNWRALNTNSNTGAPVPAFWLYDDPGTGREPLHVWFDTVSSNTFVTRGDIHSDDPICVRIRSGEIPAVPVDLDPNSPGLQQILGYVAVSLDGPDMVGSWQNRVMMATSYDGVHWMGTGRKTSAFSGR